MLARFSAFAGGALLLAVVTACSSSTEATPGSSGTTGTGGATGQQVDGCKEACNKMKFFGCNSAEQQAACYDECGKATPAQIELFTACADTSICDPACRTNITPKPAPGAPPPKGTGATASSCATACGKLVECSFIRVGDKNACVASCEKEAYQYQIDCVNNNACDKMQSACGGGSGGGEGSSSGGTSSGGTPTGVAACQSACDQMLFFDCFTSTDQSACRTACTTAAAAKRDTFSSCVSSTVPKCDDANGCYTTFKN